MPYRICITVSFLTPLFFRYQLLVHFEEKFENRTDFLVKRSSDPDPVQLFRIQIRPFQNVSESTGSGSTTLICRSNI
jgi:hypothetical protein